MWDSLKDDAGNARLESIRYKNDGKGPISKLFGHIAGGAEGALRSQGEDLSSHIYQACRHLMDTAIRFRNEKKTQLADAMTGQIYNCQSEGTCPCRSACMEQFPKMG